MLVNWIFLIFAFALSGYIGWMAQDRAAPTSILVSRVLTPITAPGALLKVEFEVYRHKNCQVDLEQILFDSQKVRYILDVLSYTVAPGDVGHETFVIPVEVPKSFAEGPARYRAVRAYRCNALQHWLNWPIVVITPDVSFQVSGPPLPADFPKEYR